MRLSHLDIIIAFIIIHIISLIIFVQDGNIDTMWIFEKGVLLFIYIAIRQIRSPKKQKVIMALILIFGIIQSLLGLLQYMEVIPSRHNNFTITGTFHNPAPYGCSLALAWVISIYMALKAEMKVQRGIYITCCLLISVFLVLSDSRAAWLASIISLVFIINHTVKIRFINHFKWIKITILLLLIGFSTLLYLHKKDSADIRLLIWRVSKDIIVESPWIGHGINSFSCIYMPYQGQFFKNNPHSIFSSIADNNTQVFNEFINTTCEQGIIGLVLILFLLFTVLKYEHSTSLISLWIVFIVFAFFSYPMEVWPLNIIPFLLAGLSASPICIIAPIRKKHFSILYIFILVVFIMGLIPVYKDQDIAIRELNSNRPQKILYTNKEYMARYGKYLIEQQEYDLFISTVTRPDFPFMTSTLQCDLGIAYQETGKMDKAEQSFKTAYYMVPSKILPQYLLFNLYKQAGQTENAKLKAEEILSSSIKQKGSVYFEARTAAFKYLEVNEKD